MAVDNSNLISLFSDIADAIRSKTGSASTIVADAFPAAITAIPAGGDPSGTKNITSNGIYDVFSFSSVKVNTGTDNSLFYNRVSNFFSVDSYSDSTISTLRNYAFARISAKSISFPNCSTLGQYCFSYGQLEYAYIPLARTVPSAAFQYCTLLSQVDVTSCTSIYSYGFRYCSSLESIDLPNCVSIGTYAFGYCYKLSTVSIPKARYFYSYAFVSCSSLASVILDNSILSIYSSVFAGCGSLSLVVCKNTNPASFYVGVFSRCANLYSLYLLGTNIPTLATTAFTSTPISVSVGGIYGSIYVRSTAYSSFIAATNWTTYSSRIVSMTDAEISTFLSTLS